MSSYTGAGIFGTAVRGGAAADSTVKLSVVVWMGGSDFSRAISTVGPTVPARLDTGLNPGFGVGGAWLYAGYAGV